MTNEELQEMGCAVMEIAEQIFHYCRADEDFCVQFIGTSHMVFGGTNRLTFNRFGWNADRRYCTPQFIRLFEKLNA